MLSLFFYSCKNYTPKPVGNNRIERPIHNYKKYEFSDFEFQYSERTKIDTLMSVDQNGYWFNIIYPEYNAVIYCSYLPINKTTLSKALDDSYHLAYSHTIKANDINQIIYSNSTIGGMIYQIEGAVATPLQFFVTDSMSNFLRGSLYYSSAVNTDSVAPITSFIEEDIRSLMQTIQFKNKK